jgi:hypothetical protein
VKPITTHKHLRVPCMPYLAIITDDNDRWAQARGLPVSAGHAAGADTLKARVSDVAELGIKLSPSSRCHACQSITHGRPRRGGTCSTRAAARPSRWRNPLAQRARTDT